MASAGLEQQSRTPVITARLGRLLGVVLLLFSLLVVNSVYLAAITWLEYRSGGIYQDYFYLLMFLLHLVLGLLLILPLLVFALAHMRRAWLRSQPLRGACGYGTVQCRPAAVVQWPAADPVRFFRGQRSAAAANRLLAACRQPVCRCLAIRTAPTGGATDSLARRCALVSRGCAPSPGSCCCGTWACVTAPTLHTSLLSRRRWQCCPAVRPFRWNT